MIRDLLSMTSKFEVVDISSDEEEDFGVGNDYVVVMDELSVPAVKQEKGFGSEACKVEIDEDCWVLDSDPYNPVVKSHEDEDEDGGTDELVIVGEKGQLACRDYPHPRHLCATFPFNSTPHEDHCTLCHCYVCDAPAPCKYWRNEKTTMDHCHSTDKEGNWKLLRQSFKQKNLVSSQPLKVPDKLPSEMTGSQNPLTPYHPNPVQEQSQTLRSGSLHPCSATIAGNTNAINTRNHERSLLYYTRRRRVGPYPTTPNRIISRTNSTRREHPDTTTLAAQITSSSRWRKTENTHPPVSRREPVRREHPHIVALAAQVPQSSRLKKAGTPQSLSLRKAPAQREHSGSYAVTAKVDNGPHKKVGTTNNLPNVVKKRSYRDTVTTQKPSSLH